MEQVSKAQIKMVRSLQIKKYRDELGLFVAEGAKCIEELRKGFEIVAEYREGENATRAQIEQMSGLETPQGVIGVFRKPSDSNAADGEGLLYPMEELALALDGIQNPGNMGTIIRTADWYGVGHIYCSAETVDCYNPKVVQATMGGLTRVKIHYVDLREMIEKLEAAAGHQEGCVPIYGTLLDGRDMYAPGAIDSNRRRGLIIMGNEGNGITEGIRRLVNRPIRIPSYPKNAETSESLNVGIATGIVLNEFRRTE